MHQRPAHQPSMPAMRQQQFWPVDIAEMPASTRTSFTRVDHDRPDSAYDEIPAVPPLPDLHLTASRFDADRRIYYDYLRDGERPVTAEGDVPPGEYRMRREIVGGDDAPADGEAYVEGGERQNEEYHHHSPSRSPAPMGESAAQLVSSNGQAQDGGRGSHSSRSNSPQEPPAQVSLTFLLVTGRRRVMTFDSQTTVGRVKELVWNTWPNDWTDTPRPTGPAYLRLLHLGRVLVDEDTLDKLSIPRPAFRPNDPNPPAANAVVHLSIRSYVPPDKGSKKRKGALNTDMTPGCCCCVQ